MHLLAVLDQVDFIVIRPGIGRGVGIGDSEVLSQQIGFGGAEAGKRIDKLGQGRGVGPVGGGVVVGGRGGHPVGLEGAGRNRLEIEAGNALGADGRPALGADGRIVLHLLFGGMHLLAQGLEGRGRGRPLFVGNALLHLRPHPLGLGGELRGGGAGGQGGTAPSAEHGQGQGQTAQHGGHRSHSSLLWTCRHA